MDGQDQREGWVRQRWPTADHLSHDFWKTGCEWAEIDGKARLAERKRKRVFAEIVNRGDGSIAAREHEARCHRDYIVVDEEAEDLRTEANVLKAKLDAMQIVFESWRTRSATKRAEMGLR